MTDPNLMQTLEGRVEGLKTPPVFDSPETLKLLCLMSGGHVRNLMQMIQKAIDWTDELPITAKAVKRAIDETRDTYNRTIQEHQWALLAQACTLRQRENDVEHMRLMLNRCLLEYRYYDQQDELQVWCNVHPLIEGIPKFQDALKKVQAAHESG